MRFSNLETLCVTSTGVSDLRPVSGCVKMKKLYLENSSVNDISPIKSLTKLQALFIENLKISDYSVLGSLCSLQRLNIDESQIDGILSANLSDDICSNLTVTRWGTVAMGLNCTKLRAFQNNPDRDYLTKLTRMTKPNSYLSFRPIAFIRKVLGLN